METVDCNINRQELLVAQLLGRNVTNAVKPTTLLVVVDTIEKLYVSKPRGAKRGKDVE